MTFSTVLSWAKQKKQPGFNQNIKQTIAEHNREALIKAGKQQFEKLKDLGIGLPVRLA